MLFMPESLTEFANQSPKLQPLFTVIEEMAVATREALGEERLAWLRGLPRIQIHGPMALVHASPETPWRAPAPEASDAELESVYGPLSQPIAVCGQHFDSTLFCRPLLARVVKRSRASTHHSAEDNLWPSI